MGRPHSRAVSPGRGVTHVIESESEGGRFLVTQSEVAFGLLDAYESTGDARYLVVAKDVRILADCGAYSGLCAEIMHVSAMRSDNMHRLRNVPRLRDTQTFARVLELLELLRLLELALLHQLLEPPLLLF